MAKKGQLLFKGDKPKKKSKSKKRKVREDGKDFVQINDHKSASSKKINNNEPTIQMGTGRITSSGTVVSGLGTKFEKEISVGDAIVVTFPDNQNTEEMRVVTMRLSNTSLNLSTAFSENLREARKFRYICKPRNAEQEHRKERQRQSEKVKEIEKSSFDLYCGTGGNTLIYREKTETGSYRVKQQELSSSQATRGDLLALRSKKTSDKYC